MGTVERMRIIATRTVKGHTVELACNGSVYFPRDLHDQLRNDLQGIHYRAKTIREFENICKLLASPQFEMIKFEVGKMYQWGTIRYGLNVHAWAKVLEISADGQDMVVDTKPCGRPKIREVWVDEIEHQGRIIQRADVDVTPDDVDMLRWFYASNPVIHMTPQARVLP